MKLTIPARSFVPFWRAVRIGPSIGTTPATDIYLATNGGTFFSLLNRTAGYVTDVTQVVWGTLTLIVRRLQRHHFL